jgi:hypothetical protein
MAERQVVPLLRAVEHGLGVALYPAQRDLVADLEATPNGAIAAGRRGGKTRTAAAVCLADLLFRPDLDALVQPGETRFAVAVATNLEQSRRLIEAARLIVDGSRAARAALTSQTADELAFTLPDGARVALRAFPCSSRGGRGYPVSTLVLDEAAHFISSEDGDATAQRVFAAMRPAQTQFGDLARCLLVSSPQGDSGFFAEMWKRANDGALARWGSYQITSKEMNPTLSDEFLALLERESPETYGSEYLALFEGGGSGFFDLEQVQIDPALGEAEPSEASGWIAGLDPAYSGVDGFGVALVGSKGGRLVLGPVRAIMPARSRGKSWEVKRRAQDAVTAEVVKLCKLYGARSFTDQHESGAVVARAAELGLKATVHGMTRERKHEAFLELRGRLYTGQLVLPNNAELLDELRRVKLKLGQGGPQIILPRSSRGHCDQVQALALAVVKHASAGQGQLLIPQGRIPGVGRHPRGRFGTGVRW